MFANSPFQKYFGEDGVYLRLASIMTDCASYLIKMSEDIKRGDKEALAMDKAYVRKEYVRLNVYSADAGVLSTNEKELEDTLLNEMIDVIFENDPKLTELSWSMPSFVKDTMLSIVKSRIREDIKKDLANKKNIDIDALFKGIVEEKKDMDPKKDPDYFHKNIDDIIDEYIERKKKESESRDNSEEN